MIVNHVADKASKIPHRQGLVLLNVRFFFLQSNGWALLIETILAGNWLVSWTL